MTVVGKTVKLVVVDEATGKTLMEYGGIPAETAQKALEIIQPIMVAAANAAAIKRGLEGLGGAVRGVQNGRRRR